ncbi:MAG: alpha/beta hydrolase [Clostridia bacterium]|nr:alpha/beta hydrolase [Clostridia bacterium]
MTELKKTLIKTGKIETELKYSIPYESKAVILIVHGMMEHSKRYSILADFILENSLGYACFDLPGHGIKELNSGQLGNWPEKGFEICADIISDIVEFLKEKHGKPVIILGHSMGAFLTIKVISEQGHKFKGCILSGTNDMDSIIFLKAGIILASIVSFFKGSDYKSSLLYNMAFGSFNNKINPVRTKFDWLTRDEERVDNYINDSSCGFTASARMFLELAKMMMEIFKRENIDSIPDELPILIFSGEKDPVGKYGTGPVKFRDRLKASGKRNVALKLYSDARHECINEINRDEVFLDIIRFCKEIAF